MEESSYRLHDTVIKWVSVPLAIAGFFIGLLTYIHQQEEKRAADKEAERARTEHEKKKLWRELRRTKPISGKIS